MDWTHVSRAIGKQSNHYANVRYRPNINQEKKKRIYKIVDFAVPADHKIKLKECEKNDKYLNLARELKKLWNTKVTIILLVQ